MPHGDRRGPMGMGPMTGRGRGFCAGGAGFWRDSGDFNRGWMGRGPGFGRGRGQRGGFAPWGISYNEADERASLQAAAETLQSQIDEINRRLEELPKQNSE